MHTTEFCVYPLFRHRWCMYAVHIQFCSCSLHCSEICLNSSEIDHNWTSNRLLYQGQTIWMHLSSNYSAPCLFKGKILPSCVLLLALIASDAPTQQLCGEDGCRKAQCTLALAFYPSSCFPRCTVSFFFHHLLLMYLTELCPPEFAVSLTNCL